MAHAAAGLDDLQDLEAPCSPGVVTRAWRLQVLPDHQLMTRTELARALGYLLGLGGEDQSADDEVSFLDQRLERGRDDGHGPGVVVGSYRERGRCQQQSMSSPGHAVMVA